jgi:hypothetical protein
VSGIWNLILNHYFPIANNYVHRPEDYVQCGYVDINTHEWIPAPPGVPVVNNTGMTQCYFLVTQCKSIARESGKEAWKEGEEQLGKYMPAMNSRHLWTYPTYGIVAVGRYVRFYELNTTTGEVSYRRGTKKWHILNNANIVHERIMEIVNKHR